MRVMVIVKGDADSESGALPSEEVLTAMGAYNEELVKAGIMLAGEGLHPSSKGKRVRFSGEQRRSVHGALPGRLRACGLESGARGQYAPAAAAGPSREWGTDDDQHGDPDHGRHLRPQR